MRERLTVLGVAILVCVAATQAPGQGTAPANTRSRLKSDVGIELLGRAVVYSFNYQRMVSPSFGLDLGLGALGGGGSGSDGLLVLIPFGARVYLIPKDGSLFLTGGGVIVSAAFDEGPFDSAADAYGYVGLGFEFRSTGGFLFRGTAYGLIGGGGWFIWPGLTVGYAF
jgi:hypothetical protein